MTADWLRELDERWLVQKFGWARAEGRKKLGNANAEGSGTANVVDQVFSHKHTHTDFRWTCFLVGFIAWFLSCWYYICNWFVSPIFCDCYMYFFMHFFAILFTFLLACCSRLSLPLGNWWQWVFRCSFLPREKCQVDLFDSCTSAAWATLELGEYTNKEILAKGFQDSLSSNGE